MPSAMNFWNAVLQWTKKNSQYTFDLPLDEGFDSRIGTLAENPSLIKANKHNQAS